MIKFVAKWGEPDSKDFDYLLVEDHQQANCWFENKIKEARQNNLAILNYGVCDISQAKKWILPNGNIAVPVLNQKKSSYEDFSKSSRQQMDEWWKMIKRLQWGEE